MKNELQMRGNDNSKATLQCNTKVEKKVKVRKQRKSKET